MERAVNSGLDANTPEKIAKAICSLQGVSNVIVQLGSIIGSPPKLPQKVTPIRSLHEFVFTSTHVTVRKVGMIGAGKKIKLEPIEFKPKYDHFIVNESQLQEGKPKKFTLNPIPGTVEHKEHTASQTVHACPKKECHAEFQSLDELTLHEDGTCFTKEPILGGETMYDLVKKTYIEEFGIRDRSDIYHEPNKGPLYHMEPLPEPSLTENLLSLRKSTPWTSAEATLSESLSMGFALPNYYPSVKNKITPLARSYVEEIWKMGVGAGGDHRNATALEVETRMKEEESEPGVPYFQPDQYLDEQQIKGLFYSLGQKLKGKAKGGKKNSDSAEMSNPPEPQDDEEQQMDLEDAVAHVDAIEASMMVNRVVDQLEETDRDARIDMNEHPMQICDVDVCALAQAILRKKRRELSPLNYLNNVTVLSIADRVGSNVLSQELRSSQKTKESAYKEIEDAIVWHVRKKCPCIPFIFQV